MSAYSETMEILGRLQRAGINATFDDAQTLRRAEMTLQRWAELECGDGDDYKSWAIERDEETGIPYFCTYPHHGTNSRRKIADKEKGAIKRVAALCQRLGIHFYHQTDPRGCTLYVSREPLTDQNYTRGIACCK